jgi:hypothetical protein
MNFGLQVGPIVLQVDPNGQPLTVLEVTLEAGSTCMVSPSGGLSSALSGARPIASITSAASAATTVLLVLLKISSPSSA